MRSVLLLGTGGTIASVESGNGLTPVIGTEELLACVPEARALCRIESRQLFSLDSTNVGPEHWLAIAAAVRENYDAFDGFVIAHGTDTMAYTAAALSYLIQKSPKPIVLTGGQKSISLQDTDARRNLFDSLLYASDPESSGVRVVFNGEIILGTRARKERTKSYNAFGSVDHPPVGIVRERRLIRYLTEEEKTAGGPVFYDRLDRRVLLLPLMPGMDSTFLREAAERCRGLVLQTFGMGGLPGGEAGDIADAVRLWRSLGRTVVMMTQVPYEGSDMSLYEVGHKVKETMGVIEAYSMTTEAVVTKLMWALGQGGSEEDVRRRFETPAARDIIRW
ncbi:MAG: asparaginase [Lachnospiraceae bacterium]|nr:asparaginase [Lachnospiraceae bacterium]